MMRAEVVVLGAGIVGVSVAVHLARRGRSVVLLDRRGPGEGTSFGNAGLIQREGVFPYAFPRDPRTLLRIAANRSIDARYDPGTLLRLAPFLARYRHHSHPRRHAAIARAYAPMIAASLAEHDALIGEAGAGALVRREGWLTLHRTPRALDAAAREAGHLSAGFGIGSAVLGPGDLARAEPHLAGGLAGAVHWTDPASVTDPQALTLAYAGLFRRLGGRLARGDAFGLAPAGGGWRVVAEDGPVEAAEAVVALGPHAEDALRPLGYRLPLAVKRGYHMHYAARGNAGLTRPVLDAERGYLLAPMARGIRLTTGAEFAARDAPPTPVQLDRAEPVARGLFPLGARLDAEPWMGARPCTPDMLPVIGPAPRHPGLWFAFGHAHHGLTLGPATGRLLAEMMTGEAPFTDPAPYRAGRFRGAIPGSD